MTRGQGRYLIALGSNVRHPRHGMPDAVLAAAAGALGAEGVRVEAMSPTARTAPVGPSRRCYANAAAIVASDLDPPAFLTLLHRLERAFGRRRRGEPWSARTLDLDIVLWSGGAWCSPGLVVPHREFRRRAFVLGPAAAIAGDWRDPLTGLSLKHLASRLTGRTGPLRWAA